MAQTRLSQVIDLSHSALISSFMKSIIGFLNNSHLHAKISTLLIIILHLVNKNLFCCIFEITCWSAVLISRNHSITRLISFAKYGSNHQRSILFVYGPSMCMIVSPQREICRSFISLKFKTFYTL